MAIFAAVPFNLSNGSLADATQVMANFNQIVANGNANAAPLASPAFSGTVTLPDASTWAGTGIANLVSLGINVAAPGTGLVNPQVGIVGVTTNSNAAAGQVGEYMSNSATGVVLTSPNTSSITSLNLTAGDWDVWGNVQYVITGGTTITQLLTALNTVNNTNPSPLNDGSAQFVAFSSTGADVQTAGLKRYSLATTTTVYLLGTCVFSGGTGVTGSGFIAARRRR